MTDDENHCDSVHGAAAQLIRLAQHDARLNRVRDDDSGWEHQRPNPVLDNRRS